MRAVVDTNVLISAILFGGAPREVIEAAEARRFELIGGPHLWQELESVLVRSFSFSAEAAQQSRIDAFAVADTVELMEIPRVARDPKDDYLLATAVAGHADVLVSGDKDILSLEMHGDVRIVTVRQFLELLEGDGV